MGQCPGSAGLVALKQSRAKPQPEPDFGTPFEICYYCKATIVRPGSRWSTFYCELCRPLILEINQARDSSGLSVVPIGRHSMMHTNWHHVAPGGLVDAWRHENLGHYWGELQAAGARADDWMSFATFIGQTKTSTRFRDLERPLKVVGETPPDPVLELMRQANARLKQPQGARP